MSDNLNTDMGIRIKELRIKKGYTREKLAEKADISTQFLADIEYGRYLLYTSFVKPCVYQVTI